MSTKCLFDEIFNDKIFGEESSAILALVYMYNKINRVGNCYDLLLTVVLTAWF